MSAGFFARDLTTIAFCWRVARRDGVVIGLTSHDRDLVIDGLVYRAAPGMLPSAIEASDGLDAEAMDVAGALTSDAITETDLVAGRWDGAQVRVFAVDWEDPGEQVLLARGELGAVEVEKGSFSAELRGPAAALEAPVVEETSPECRAELGDWRCRVDMAGRSRIARVVSADGEMMLTLDAAEPSAGGWAWGTLRWLDGANSGLTSAVLASAGPSVTLRDPPFFAPEPGVRVRLTEGCDKSLATCAGRFANAANFRGEPHLPGNDLLTRYPGS